MLSETVKINTDGTLVLPEKLRAIIKNTPELQVSWNDRFIVINDSISPQFQAKFDQEADINQFFAQLDQLIAFNEIEAITKDDIQTEIADYRSQKRSQIQL
jgi:archaellum biogenesis ATPase FlaH